MRSWTDLKIVLCAVCVAGGVACSDDDPDGGIANPPANGGSAGAAGSAGAGGSAGQGGAAGGAVTAGSGGSAGAAAGASGGAGAPGVAVTSDAGVVVSAPDAGDGPGEPDAGGGDPGPVDPGPVDPVPVDPEPTVTFGDVFPVLVARCGGCHGANAPGARPRFAVTGNEAASFAATQAMSQGAVVSARIITLAVNQGSMPPACGGGDPGQAGCISVAEATQLSAWVDQGAQP